MLLTTTLVAGSALAASSILYKKHKDRRVKFSRQSKTYWTDYAKRFRVVQMGKMKKRTSVSPLPFRTSESLFSQKKAGLATLASQNSLRVSSLFRETNEVVQKLKQKVINPLVGQTRRQQLNELEVDGQKPINETQKRANRNLAIASASLGLATAGALFYAPLSWLSLPGVFHISRLSYISSYNSIVKERKVNVDTLFTLTTILLVGGGQFFFATVSVFNYALNRKLLTTIKDNSQKSVVNVFRQQSRFVWVLVDGVEVEIPIDELKYTDTVVVSAGGTIPVDGYITDGSATIDQRILTGESQPVEKETGEEVFALTIVLAGRILIQVEKAGEETTAAQIAEILNQSVEVKTNMQLWSERISDQLVLPAIMLGGCTWPMLGLTSAISVLQSHFKYKGTIGTSISTLNFLNLASLKGILVKDGRAFELLNQVDTVVFDKTGTLTSEQPHVEHIYTYNGYKANEVLTYTAAVEHKQNHPIAKAILEEAERRHLTISDIDDAQYMIGYGLTAKVNRQLIQVGSIRFIEMEEMPIPPDKGFYGKAQRAERILAL